MKLGGVGWRLFMRVLDVRAVAHGGLCTGVLVAVPCPAHRGHLTIGRHGTRIGKEGLSLVAGIAHFFVGYDGFRPPHPPAQLHVQDRLDAHPSKAIS